MTFRIRNMNDNQNYKSTREIGICLHLPLNCIKMSEIINWPKCDTF